MTTKTKPFATYNGGKESDGTYQKIISIMPPHDIYIEAFIGGGAILRIKKPASLSSIGIDLDAHVIQEWNNSRYGTAVNDHPGCTFINTDAILWLEMNTPIFKIMTELGYKILVYCDPPYPMHSRKNTKALYHHEFTPDDHSRLLDVILKMNVYCIISSYPNRGYDEALANWQSFVFKSTTRKGSALEKIYHNFAAPTVLHDYRFIGKDYRDRERIKGIVSREVSKFNRMADLEKNYIIEKLGLQKNGSIRQL